MAHGTSLGQWMSGCSTKPRHADPPPRLLREAETAQVGRLRHNRRGRHAPVSPTAGTNDIDHEERLPTAPGPPSMSDSWAAVGGPEAPKHGQSKNHNSGRHESSKLHRHGRLPHTWCQPAGKRQTKCCSAAGARPETGLKGNQMRGVHERIWKVPAIALHLPHPHLAAWPQVPAGRGPTDADETPRRRCLTSPLANNNTTNDHEAAAV